LSGEAGTGKNAPGSNARLRKKSGISGPPAKLHLFVAELPADPDNRNISHQVMGACYSHVLPTPVAAPWLVAHSAVMVVELGLAPDDAHATDSFTAVLSVKRL
jgi:hypothetical protein